eukprot:CAMPEP_0194147158 /NCGR_PEP_ID=MMETSP0152-20130528/22555_1 /TAXON_ID=1049557 /ORGANISM="Thalassiothrix antarctica, Strain L6-D1" /LENGTH=370 /DNA_ID=CAMNT_0038847855 /DNA_START=16 /DNA_END=1129 /DNA_ORIENTATION=-
MGIIEVDDDITIEKIRSLINKASLTTVVAVASFVPKCEQLMSDLGKLNGSIIVLKTDESDELEEVAIELGLKNIPSYQIYTKGVLTTSSKEGSEVTVDSIQQSLEKAATSCCPPSSSNCAPSNNSAVACCPNPNADQPSEAADILKLVSTSYANTVNKNPGGCCVSEDPNLNAYDMEELIKAGAKEANLGLGCGNPLTFSKLQEGETVVDLGSGAGIDCFLASQKVGASGKVIGIDMTPDMLSTARANAKKRLQGDPNRNDNVQFRLGEIEYLPVADNVADCVISNCVINLSPDKPQVFTEIFRILKKGGRIAISDVVNRPDVEIPIHLKTAEALLAESAGLLNWSPLMIIYEKLDFVILKLNRRRKVVR